MRTQLSLLSNDSTQKLDDDSTKRQIRFKLKEAKLSRSSRVTRPADLRPGDYIPVRTGAVTPVVIGLFCVACVTAPPCKKFNHKLFRTCLHMYNLLPLIHNKDDNLQTTLDPICARK